MVFTYTCNSYLRPTSGHKVCTWRKITLRTIQPTGRPKCLDYQCQFLWRPDLLKNSTATKFYTHTGYCYPQCWRIERKTEISLKNVKKCNKFRLLFMLKLHLIIEVSWKYIAIWCIFHVFLYFEEKCFKFYHHSIWLRGFKGKLHGLNTGVGSSINNKA